MNDLNRVLPGALGAQLRIPVIASPLFIASSRELVAAQCRAGVIGSFPALNARSTAELDEWLSELSELTQPGAGQAGDTDHAGTTVAPFAVNQIVHRSNLRLEADMEMIAKHRVPIVITSLGARPEINEAVHSYGGVVLHDVIHNTFARKAIEKGADGLIAVAAGAGGHAGAQSPFALVREIREWFDGPLVLSGAIAHGASLLGAIAAGADFGYVGSAFLGASEANTSQPQREVLLESGAEDIVYTNFFTGVHGNYLRGSIIRAGIDPDALETADPSKMDFGKAGSDTKAWRDIWGAGQGVGSITEITSAGAIVDRLSREYDSAASRMTELLRSRR